MMVSFVKIPLAGAVIAFLAQCFVKMDETSAYWDYRFLVFAVTNTGYWCGSIFGRCFVNLFVDGMVVGFLAA